MLKKYFKGMFYILMIVLTLLPGCSTKHSGETDNRSIAIDTPINSVKDGMPFAAKRVGEWGKDYILNAITVGYNGKEQIKSRKGSITYSYAVSKDGKTNYSAIASVIIDMNKNSIDQFSISYDPRIKERKISEKERKKADRLNTEKWKIDINKAFEICINALGEDKIFKYDNPKLVLRCTQTFWEFCLYPTLDAKGEDILVVIDPESGEIIRIENRAKE